MRVWQKRIRGQRQTPFSSYFYSILSFFFSCAVLPPHPRRLFSSSLPLSLHLTTTTTTTTTKNKKKPGSTIVLYHHHHHRNNNTVRCVQSLTPCASTDKTTTLFLTMQWCASALLVAAAPAAAVGLSNDGWKRSKMRIDHTHQFKEMYVLLHYKSLRVIKWQSKFISFCFKFQMNENATFSLRQPRLRTRLI